ncbi:MAG: hypothetical protein M3Z64_07740 [Verrucomicrobiota bacterium]|nr:hypothetical protein [Verrucomicrobiota bacterium]
MTNTVIEPPPQRRGMGCLGKGCLFLIGLILLLVLAFTIGGYVGVRYVITSDKPREIPAVATSPEQQQEVRERWDEFAKASRGEGPAEPDQSAPQTSATPSQILFTADDLNQLIAANRKARGKAYVTIENNVGHVQVSIPLTKAPFRGRFLNGEFQVHASPDRDPRKMRVEKISLSGVDVPESALNALVGGRSLTSYIDQYASEYRVTGFAIENNTVVLETNAASR